MNLPADTYTIEVRRGRFFWVTRITRIGIGNPETCPTFRARSYKSARRKAERWCGRDHARRQEPERYEFDPAAFHGQPPRPRPKPPKPN